MTVCETHSGHCPYFNEECEIEVDYIEVTVTNLHKRQFKKNGFYCSANEDDDCTYSLQNRCPVYEQSPLHIEG